MRTTKDTRRRQRKNMHYFVSLAKEEKNVQPEYGHFPTGDRVESPYSVLGGDQDGVDRLGAPRLRGGILGSAGAPAARCAARDGTPGASHRWGKEKREIAIGGVSVRTRPDSRTTRHPALPAPDDGAPYPYYRRRCPRTQPFAYCAMQA